MFELQTPSLFDNSVAVLPFSSISTSSTSSPAVAMHQAHSLLDLLYDGFYLVFLLRTRYAPADAMAFRDRIKHFLSDFEGSAKRLGVDADDIHLVKYAYCAMIDEVVLTSPLHLRDAWARQPLQLEFFGDQLAGERFFKHLEALRHGNTNRVQVLEVFHMCLLLGYQGRYLLEGSEKLGYLIGRLGDEIANLRGRRAAFAPHWAAPDRATHALKRDVPLWVVASVFAIAGLLAFVSLRSVLKQQTRDALAPYVRIVNLAPLAANITITLP